MLYKVYNQNGEEIMEKELNPLIFNIKVKPELIYQAVVTQQANERQILAHTKDRSEVSGGGKKPWRQKGTGRARHGSIRSPIWKGGGVTFGPTKYRVFKKKINKKMKQKALLMALTDKAINNNLIILDKFELDKYKTKIADKILKNLEKIIQESRTKKQKTLNKTQRRSIMIILSKKDKKAQKSLSNLPNVKFLNLGNINILDLLKYRDLILTLNTIKNLEKRYIK